MDPTHKPLDSKVALVAGAIAATISTTCQDGPHSSGQPDFGGHFDGVMARILQRGHAATDDERALVRIRYHQLELDPQRGEEVRGLARFLRITLPA